MKQIFKAIAIAFYLLILTAVYLPALAKYNKVDSLNFIFKPGENNYSCFRIPALICTKQGTLLAFAEGRKNNCGDSGDIDLVLKRSVDDGKTWSNLQVVWSDSTNICGNPVPVQDVSTGKIWLISTWNPANYNEKQDADATIKQGRRVFVMHSDDDGKNWSTAADITEQVKKAGWGWYATGPCHGVQIANGKYAGRLIVPVNHVEKKPRRNFANIIYSDDHGLSWHLGGNTPQDKMNEATVTEISSGRLMLNMRNGDRTIRIRHTSISNDGGNTWSNVTTDSVLIEPICEGSLLSYFYSRGKPTVFFLNPANDKKRMNMTLRMSEDDGKTWKYNKVLYAGAAGYSDMAVIDKNTLGCFYEAGYTKAAEGIVFEAIQQAQLKVNK